MDEGKTFEKIINIFQQIETCEEVIETFKDHPNFYYINKTILPYKSEIVTTEYPLFLFTNHCKEIAYRLGQIYNEMTKKQVYDIMKIPTKAEMVIMGKDATLVSRLQYVVEQNLLYMFRKILDEENMNDPDLKEIKGTLHEYFLDMMYDVYSNEERSKIVWEMVKKEKEESK